MPLRARVFPLRSIGFAPMSFADDTLAGGSEGGSDAVLLLLLLLLVLCPRAITYYEGWVALTCGTQRVHTA